MKLILGTLLMLIAMVVLTYMNMWQTKNIDTQGKILNGELLRFLVWYGIVIFFFANPIIVLSFRYIFSFYGKLMIPQLAYLATTIISPLIVVCLIFHETPTKGIIAGTFFAIISVLCVLFWK